MLKEFANDRADLESIAVTRWVGEEPAHSADDEVDAHAALRRLIQEGNHLNVNECIHLCGDVRGATPLRLSGGGDDALTECVTESRRRHEKALILSVL